LTVLVTWFIADRIGIGLDEFTSLGPEWWTPNWILAVAASALLLATNLCSGLVWGRMVADLGGGRLHPWVAIQIFLLANLGRYVPGKLWQVAGLVLLAKRRGVPGTVATGAAILGHGLSLGAATLVGGVVFHRSTLVGGVPGWVVVGAVAAALALACTPPVFHRLASTWARLTGWELRPSDLSPGDTARWVSLFILIWLAYGAAFFLFAKSFGVEGPLFSIGPAFVAAYVIGYVAVFAPAGIGVREVAIVGLLAPTVGTAAATGLAIVARLWITVVEVIPGVAFMSRELATSHADETGAGGP
jgi:hypothetical protein